MEYVWSSEPPCVSDCEATCSRVCSDWLFHCSSRQASHSPVRSRSLSPHSPHKDKALDISSGVGGARGPVCGEEGDGRGKGEGLELKGDGGEVQSVGAGKDFLFQVSEAHLALYPDEDGDTYVIYFMFLLLISLNRYKQ